ncbi:MAG: hypothetical protein IK066_05170 [Kiritimatiellae bacterium]|nr:hypothetical protein [Kiritimatiellia bacterium]
MRTNGRIWKRVGGAVWLAAWCATAAWGKMPGYVRRLRPAHEPRVAARIEEWRGRLDEELQERYNFAWCLAVVEGKGRVEYIAHSGLGGPEDASEESWALVAGAVAPDVPPERRHYESLCVNRRNSVDGEDCWDRGQDTEFKILEAVTEWLGDCPEATGKVALYTDLPPCASCMRVIEEFKGRYPGIRLSVKYK